MNYDVILKKHAPLISAYARTYCNGYNYSDFKQELFIAVWNDIKDHYDPTIAPIENFIGSRLKYLAIRILHKMNKNKQLQFEESFENIEDLLFLINDDKARITDNIKWIIENKMNDTQKNIVYMIDAHGVDDKCCYKNIADKLKMSQRMLYYYLTQIRDIFRENVRFTLEE